MKYTSVNLSFTMLKWGVKGSTLRRHASMRYFQVNASLEALVSVLLTEVALTSVALNFYKIMKVKCTIVIACSGS